MNKGLMGKVKISIAFLSIALLTIFVVSFVLPSFAYSGGSICTTTGTYNVCTDYEDYAPEEIVLITGNGFANDTQFLIKVIRPEGPIVTGNDTSVPWPTDYDYVSTDVNGNFVFIYDLDGVIGSYTVQVLDPLTSDVLATHAFTDKQTMTFTSSPVTGSGFITVDGTARTTPYTQDMNNKDTAILHANSPVSGGTGIRYVFTNWTGSIPSFSPVFTQDFTYTATSAAETITAKYNTQYQVSFAANGGGTTSPSGINVWENAGSLSISATANSGYFFDHWSSSTGSITFASTTSATTTATIGATGTITANFATLIGNGESCSANGQCTSGYCTDGYCCQSSCGGTCEACNQAGRLGYCDPIPSGTYPLSECADQGASSCGRTGYCSGLRSCALYASGTVCKDAFCSGLTSNLQDTCNGLGICNDGGTQSCNPYICSTGNGLCKASCTINSDCAPTYFCNAGTCTLDTTPPSISGAATTSPNANNWYNSNVVVHFTCTDSGSGVASLTPDTTLSTSAAGQHVLGTCTDNLGNSATYDVTGINIDMTPPTAVLSVKAGTTGTNGWYTSDVTVQTTGSDTLSGPISCTADQFQATETTGTIFHGSCTNLAGLSTDAAPLTVKLDKTGPSATLAVTAGTLGLDGWYTSDVTVHASGSDAISDNVVCTADQHQTTETAGHIFNGQCTNDAGLSTNATSLTIKLDKTGPSAALSITAGTLGSNGWYTSDVTIHASGTDAISDSVTCTADQSQTTETTGTVFNGACTNDAGLSTNAAPLTVKLDKTGPSASLSVTAGTAGANGWYISDVTVHTSGTDAISDSVVCTADQHQTAETTGAVFNGACTNNAGLSTNAAPLTVKLDKTGPSATLAVTAGTLGSGGWYTSDVTVSTSGVDSISDNVVCTADQHQTSEATGTVFHSTCTNDAGLSTNAAPLTVKLDKTGPSAALSVTAGTLGSNGWYTSDVTVHTSGSDAVSDSVVCTADQYQTSETSSTGVDFHGSCTNGAGLSTDASTLTIKLDSTAPVISWNTPAADTYFKNGDSISVAATVTESGSGITVGADCNFDSTGGMTFSGTVNYVQAQGKCIGDITITNGGGDGARQLSLSLTDLAGNTGDSGHRKIYIDNTAPTISGAATTSPNPAGWYKTDVTVHFTCTDSGSGVHSLTPDTTLTNEGAGQHVLGTCVDNIGNSATFDVKGINIDKTAPVITVTGNNPETIEVYSSYTDAGATFTDNLDSSVIVVSSGSVNTALVGDYTIYYDAVDIAGNNAVQKSRIVHVVDITPPVITLLGSSPVTLEVHSTYTDTGATASDNYDGDLTSSIVTINPVNKDVVGVYTVTYDVTDAHGNHATQVTRTVNVVDTTPPIIGSHIGVTAEATSSAGATVTYILPIATDNYDASVTVICTPLSGSTFALGYTTVTCNAKDSHNNAATSTTFVVHVVDTTAPTIDTHANVGPIEATSASGAIVTYASPATSDAVDGPGVANCAPVSGSTFSLGDTTVYCDAVDAAGNHAIQTTFNVHVHDTTAPTIDNVADIVAEATSPSGASVKIVPPMSHDAVDGDLVSSCDYSSGIFPIAVTTVICSKTDAAGNVATPETFTVTVQDILPPTVSISGAPSDWTNTDQTATVTCSDTGSGCDSGSYKIKIYSSDPVTCPSDYSEYTLLDSQTISSHSWVCGTAKDNVGNVGYSSPVEFKVDEIAPTITDDYSNDNVWINTATGTITLTPIDTGDSGLKTDPNAVKYCTGLGCDPSTGTALSSPYQLSFSTEQDAIVRYQSYDNAGSSSTIGEFVVKIDLTAPIISCTVPDQIIWYNDNVIVTCTASDDGSGLADSGDAGFSLSTSVSTGTETASASTDSHQVCDDVGNCDTAGPYTFKVDKKAPVISCGSADDLWHANDVSVACTASDGGSGLKVSGDVSFNLNTNVAPDTETDNAATGTHNVCDAVDNCVTTGPTTGNKVDKKNPQLVSCEVPDGLWHAGDATLKCTYSDGGSGPTTQDVSLLTSVTAGIETDNAVASAGGAQACDAIGNCATTPSDIAGNMIDKKAPTIGAVMITPIYVDVSTTFISGTSDISASVTDSGSGVAGCEYTLDGSIWVDAVYSSGTCTATGIDTSSATSVNMRATDKVGNVGTGTPIAVTPDITAPTTTDTSDTNWHADDQIITITPDDDSGSGVASTKYCVYNSGDLACNPTTVGTSVSVSCAADSVCQKIVRYYPVDNVGNTEVIKESNVVQIDKTKPSTTDNVPSAWQTAPFDVTFVCTDSGSGCSKIYYTTDGVDPTTSSSIVTAPNWKFNVATDGVYTIKYMGEDAVGNLENFKTSPEILKMDQVAPSTIDNYDGLWHTSAFTITLSANDVTSGVASTHYKINGGLEMTVGVDGQPLITTESATNSLEYWSVDVAGNVELPHTTVNDIKLDTVAPSTTDNYDGLWHTADFTITLSASDSTSGVYETYYKINGGATKIVSVDGQPLITTESATNSLEYWSVDVAGNEESHHTLSTIKLDKTAPSISGSRTPSANGYGWNNVDVTAKFVCSDTLSGISACTPDTTLTGEGANQHVLGTATDLAGNSNTFDITNINIDKTAPSIDGAPTTSPNANGWYKTDVVVHYTCTDTLSTVDTLTGDQTLSTEAADQSTSGTCVDKAGNSASATVSDINIDKTAPTIEGSRTPLANANGWNNEDVTAKFTCDDALSGVKDCTKDTVVSTEGKDQKVTGTVTDKAGNSATYDVTEISIDKTKPSTTDDFTNDGAWVNYDQSIKLTPSDADPSSGIEYTKYCTDSIGTCEPTDEYTTDTPITFTTDGETYLRYVSKDKAGNEESVKQKVVKIDETAPIGSIIVNGVSGSTCNFWLQWWIDSGSISYDVVHGCALISANIDASVSGLKSYTLTLYNSQNQIVGQSTNDKIDFNFETAETTYRLVLEGFDNAGNYFTAVKDIYEDDDNDYGILKGSGGAPDLFDLCPSQVPSLDLNHDGCQDIQGTSIASINWCIDTYTGSAVTSLNPTTSLTQIGSSFNQGSKVWYNMVSSIASGVGTTYAMNIVDKQGQNKDEIHCSIDTSSIKTSSATFNIIKKDNEKFVYKDIKGTLRVKEGYHNLELGDGTKIQATMKYNDNKDSTKLQLVYDSEQKNKVCNDAANAAKDACKTTCGKDKQCQKTCDDKLKKDKDACRDKNHYQISTDYPGLKTLSVYDILKLTGYE